MLLKSNLVLTFFAAYSISIDCPNIINLALGMRMDIRKPAVMDQIREDCCDTDSNPSITYTDVEKLYVVCNLNSRVIEINWYFMNLNGRINGTALTPKLRFLGLNNNALTGSIPNALPTGLLYLDTWENSLTGSLPDPLPTGLVELSVEGNQLTGTVPFFPTSLTNLWLGYPGKLGNHFVGSVSINQPVNFFINGNWITDIIIQDSSKFDDDHCDLSDNPLLGNPHLTPLTNICKMTGLYSANSLPNTISTPKYSSSVAFSTGTSTKVISTVIASVTSVVSISSSLKIPLIPTTTWTSKNTQTTSSDSFSTKNSPSTYKMATHGSTIALPVLPSNTNDFTQDTVLALSEQMFDTNAISFTTYAVTSDSNPSSTFDDFDANLNVNQNLIYEILGIFALIFAALLVAKLVFKNPKVHSKYGRKNSFGTLNTMATKQTASSS